MKRYYTPTIEEFHTGFEYEVFEKGQVDDPRWLTFMPIETEDKWYKFKYPDPFLGYRVDKLFENRKVRVKYLDEEDLISLGFTITEKATKSYGYYLKGHIAHDYKRTEIWYSFLTDKDEIYISLKNSHYNGNGKFHIKNKSELKKLLKQLKIID